MAINQRVTASLERPRFPFFIGMRSLRSLLALKLYESVILIEGPREASTRVKRKSSARDDRKEGAGKRGDPTGPQALEAFPTSSNVAFLSSFPQNKPVT